jgi:hypothetical protein
MVRVGLELGVIFGVAPITATKILDRVTLTPSDDGDALRCHRREAAWPCRRPCVPFYPAMVLARLVALGLDAQRH